MYRLVEVHVGGRTKSVEFFASEKTQDPEASALARRTTLPSASIVGRDLLTAGEVPPRTSETRFWVTESCWSAAFLFRVLIASRRSGSASVGE